MGRGERPQDPEGRGGGQRRREEQEIRREYERISGVRDADNDGDDRDNGPGAQTTGPGPTPGKQLRSRGVVPRGGSGR